MPRTSSRSHGAHAARQSPSNCRSHASSRFQLAKLWLTHLRSHGVFGPRAIVGFTDAPKRHREDRPAHHSTRLDLAFGKPMALLLARHLQIECLSNRRATLDALAWSADKQVPWLLVTTQEILAPGIDASAVLDACGFAPLQTPYIPRNISARDRLNDRWRYFAATSFDVSTSHTCFTSLHWRH